MNTANTNNDEKRESITIYFVGDDIALRERIAAEARARRQPISSFMKAAAEYFIANTKSINED